jgi:hypothetical protein
MDTRPRKIRGSGAVPEVMNAGTLGDYTFRVLGYKEADDGTGSQYFLAIQNNIYGNPYFVLLKREYFVPVDSAGLYYRVRLLGGCDKGELE